MTDTDVILRCAFCGRRTTLAEAPDQDWYPYFGVGEVEIDQPVCLTCGDRIRYEHETGEMVASGPIGRPLVVFTFHLRSGREDTFRFLTEPDASEIEFLASNRPGCGMTRANVTGWETPARPSTENSGRIV